MYALPLRGRYSTRSGADLPGFLTARRLAMAALAAGLLAAAGSQVASGGSGPPRYDTVTVQPGDTLWGIARAHYPDADVREAVDGIVADNHLPGVMLQPGQQLRLRTER